MQNFRNLQAWRMAHALVLSAYGATGEFPKDEQFGLTAQIRRAVASIPANIAEGCGRGSDRDFARHLQIPSVPLASWTITCFSPPIFVFYQVRNTGPCVDN